MDEDGRTKEKIESWRTLVHVCRQWRSAVFESPRRLNLRLVCTSVTPARDTLDVWPALPLVIQCHGPIVSMDDIVAVLERSNRVCQIELRNLSSSCLKTVSAAMQEPFPELTDLELKSNDETMPVLLGPFLGGSAPCLRSLELGGIPFPGLPKLLLSATHLVTFRFERIPHSGYFSPQAILSALSTLTSLKTLWLEFESPRSCPDLASRRPPPPTRFILPALTYFFFQGVSEYLDDLVAGIEAPRLCAFYITFFNQIVFDTPQLIQFIGRTPSSNALQNAHFIFSDSIATVRLSSRTSELEVKVSCRELDWQVSSLEQVCTSCLPPLSTLEVLYIYGASSMRADRPDKIEKTLWLELLQPFTSVTKLYLSDEFAQGIVPALRERGGTTEVLPTLQNIFLKAPAYRDLSRKAFSNLLPRDRPVTP